MALETSLLELPIGAGLNEGIDPKLLQPGALLVAKNLICTKQGSLEKRLGYDAFTDQSTTGVTGAVCRLFGVGATQYCIGQVGSAAPRLFQYGTSATRWADIDEVSVINIERRSIARSHRNVFSFQVVSDNQIACYVWQELDEATGTASYAYYKVVDESTGATLQDDTRLQAGDTFGNIKVIKVGARAVILYVDAGTANLYCRTLVLSSGVYTAGAAVLIDTLLANTTPFDACAISSTDFAIVYQYNATDSRIRTYTGNAVFVANNNIAGYAFIAVSGLASDNLIWVGAYNGVTPYFMTYDVALFPVLAPTIATGMAGISTLERLDATNVLIAYTDQAAFGAPFVSNYYFTQTRRFTSAGATAGALQRTNNHQLVSRIYPKNGKVYAVLSGTSTEDNSLKFVELRDASDWTSTRPALPVAGIARGVSGGSWSPPLYGIFGISEDVNSAFYGATVLADASSTRLAGGALAANQRRGGDVVRIDFEQTSLDFVAQAATGIVTSGGLTSYCDGQALVESGYEQPPEIVEIEAAPPPGAFPVGTYAITAVYEWLGADGTIHRSQPAIPKSWTSTGATVAPQVLVRNLNVTRKQSLSTSTRAVRIVTYLTSANGFVYVANSWVENNLTQAGTVFPLTIWANPGTGNVYTTGGVLENVPPPASKFVTQHKNRIWLISAEDPREIWYSKEIVPPNAPEFSDVQKIRLDATDTPPVALASLDDKLVIFTETTTHYIVGDGPNDTGGGGSFSEPILLSKESGCAEPRSVLTYDGGVVFQESAGRIYQVGRGLKIDYLSLPIQDTLSTYQTIVRAVCIPGKNWLMFVARYNDQSWCKLMVLDYRFSQWIEWTPLTYDLNAPDILDISTDGESHYFCTADTGYVYQYGLSTDGLDHTGTTPATQWITGQVNFPWVNLQRLQGFERCRRVTVSAQALGEFELGVAIYHDYKNSGPQIVSWPATDLPLMLNYPDISAQIHVAQQKCSAIRVLIVDAPDGSTPAPQRGWRLQGITLELASKRGSNKLPTDNKR